MKIAAFGDVHGHWGRFHDAVSELHRMKALDLVLQCGDAQPFRNDADLEYMHCPKKYRELGDFRMFHQREYQFPVPVLLIGGNHEPWNFLDENRDGGALAPNIEFIGRVGMRDVGGLRIVGLSGIFSPKYFTVPHLVPPYSPLCKKQAAYYNETDIETAMSFGHADILLLHGWPHLMNEARTEAWPDDWSDVGCEYLSMLVDELAPRWTFCGHMHFPSRHRHRRTEIVCLSDFARDPDNAVAVLDPDTGLVTSASQGAARSSGRMPR